MNRHRVGTDGEAEIDNLAAQLEALLVHHARAQRSDPAVFEQSIELFRKGVRRLVAEFGYAAVDAALDDMPDEPWPSVALH